MEYAAVTDVGLKRRVNEDNYTVLEGREWNLFAVADGMGGHAAGEVASRMALQVLEEELADSLDSGSESLPARLRSAVQRANKAIYRAALEHREYSQMGTTLTSLIISPTTGESLVAHIGDSRAYLFRRDGLEQLSHDHSLVGELMARGRLSEREAMRHPQRHFLSRALGTDSNVEADILEFQSQSGDMILLCTDGLSSLLFNDTIKEVMQGSRDLETAARKLVGKAIDRGGDDNITVILLRIERLSGEG